MLPITTIGLEQVRLPVRDRLDAVEQELRGMVPSGFGALDEVGEYLFARSGKLLRPTLLLLADGVAGRPPTDAVKLGAIVELLHVATLVHDDAVDHSARRRGRPTVNHRWTHQVAIIAGDYLYSRAVIEVAALGKLEPVSILAHTANRMTIGEMRQLVLHDGLDFSRADYEKLCEYKTASLMSAACELGTLPGALEYRGALRVYGHHLGMAFQIVDDLLDYTSSTEIMGKPPGQDLQEHKVTLPLIAALPKMGWVERRAVEALFEDAAPSSAAVREIVDLVEAHGGVESARDEARSRASRARDQLEGLPPGPCLDALGSAVDYVVERVR
ncbi:polyprenyl synthetase family protein [Candidatus Palauibacter sp.]|uniref:polyprenyl synthetase family protein n=1 Tax=Candidatus Palauibacter sp. TaxID=3101350 RepID=UPI003B5A4C98